MKKYVKTYLDYFGYGEQDYMGCENCNIPIHSVHHLKFRSQGGKDTIDNLMGLCLDCHTEAHNSREFNDMLKEKHKKRINDI